MGFNDGPHPALLIDEVLENILEYAASGELFKTSSNLRLVCKQWQSLSFKALCRSTSLPVIDMFYNIDSLDKQENLFEGGWQVSRKDIWMFRKQLRKKISAFMAIPPSRLPIGIRIPRLLLHEDVAVIRKLSGSIASIELGDFDSLDANIKSTRLYRNQEYDFKLPNLRSIKVSWGKINNFKPWQRLLQNILGVSNRRVVMKYVGVGESSRPNNWPIALPQLTHLQFTGLPTDLGRFITASIQLVELVMYGTNESYVTGAESVALTAILERHAATLQKVEISNMSKLGVVGTLQLPPAQFLQLRALETNLPILLSKDRLNLTYLPKMKELEYVAGCYPVEESDGFKVSHLVSKSLVKLHMRWNQSGMPDGRRESQILNNFVEESFPVYPELLDLTIDGILSTSNGMPFHFGLALMPKLADCVKNLTRLRLCFVRKDGAGRQFIAKAGVLVEILTGVSPESIPINPRLWPGLFKDKPATITKLKNLTELTIDTVNTTQFIFGKFIFDAAFLKMEKLKMIRLGGYVTVEDEMIQKWRSIGREIHVRDRFFRFQDLNA